MTFTEVDRETLAVAEVVEAGIDLEMLIGMMMVVMMMGVMMETMEGV